MTTVVSAIPTTIDTLLTVFASAGVTAIDGQGATDDPSGAVVYVGLTDPDGEELDTAASSDQEWASLGHTQRDETLEVHCVASAWSGDDAPKAVRDAAFAMLRALSDAITSDPSLISSQSLLYVKSIGGVTLRQSRTSEGARADIPFTITCRARLS